MTLSSSSHSSSSHSSLPLPPTKGSASTPLVKRKVAVLGAGGYVGALVVGFLQRAGSLYPTGLSSSVRTVGATADTSWRLNRCLSQQFVLAYADESYVKLTNLSSPDAIQQWLQGWNALILGNALTVQRRPVTLNTYERTPNDQTYEIYWDAPRGAPPAVTSGEDASTSSTTTTSTSTADSSILQQQDEQDAVVNTIRQ